MQNQLSLPVDSFRGMIDKQPSDLIILLLSKYRQLETKDDTSEKEQVAKQVKDTCEDHPELLDLLIYLDRNERASEVVENLKNDLKDSDDFITSAKVLLESIERADLRENAMYWLLERYDFAAMNELWYKLTPVQRKYVQENDNSNVPENNKPIIVFLFKLIEPCSNLYEKLTAFWREERSSAELQQQMDGGAVGGLVTGGLSGAIIGAKTAHDQNFGTTALEVVLGAVLGAFLGMVLGYFSACAVQKIRSWVQDWLRKPKEKILQDSYKYLGVTPDCLYEELQANFIKLLKTSYSEVAFAKVFLKKALVDCAKHAY